MTDVSVRIPVNNYRILYLEKNAINKVILSGVSDTMYKPVGADLKNYHPKIICLRLREIFGKPSSLTEIKTAHEEVGYSDQKNIFAEGSTEELQAKALEMEYEVWGKMQVSSIEFTLKIGKNIVSVLLQEIKPIGKYLKIEAPNTEALRNCLKALRVEKREIINNNAAVLLAEKMGLV